MVVPNPEISGCSIVIVGDFPPGVFHPTWFVSRGLLAQEEADIARIEIVSTELTVFSGTWLRFTADRQKIQFVTASEPLIRLFDLAVGVVALFPETPVHFVGLNREAHVKMSTFEAFHKVGDKLAPKDCWPKEFREYDKQKPQLKPGLRSLIMEKARSDPPGYLHIRIEPSQALRPTGIFFASNDHYDFTQRSQPLLGSEAVEVIANHWNSSMEYADCVRTWILEHAG